MLKISFYWGVRPTKGPWINRWLNSKSYAYFDNRKYRLQRTYECRDIPLGLRTIPLGLRTIPLGLRTISLGLRTIPLGLRTISLGLRTILQ